MPIRNRLLRSLPPASLEALSGFWERVDLPIRTTLVEPGQPTPYVHFLESGLASAVATCQEGNERIEVGHIGFEGMTGLHTFLGADHTPTHTFMQVAGSGLRVSALQLRELMDGDRALRTQLLRYAHAYHLQVAYSALANGRYTIPQRLARWLLMCQDRLGTDELPLTHEFLALMLGVRRSGVTNEIHVLEGEHAIRASRARILVRDRAKLEEMAGGCYGLPEAEYERLLRLPHPAETSQADLTGKRILVVEDEYALATEMEEDLTARGADVVGPVPSVEDALDLVSATPDLNAAILDVNLGGEMAFPLAEALRERGVPFVFVSGYQRSVVPDRFRDVPFHNKPAVPADIAAALLAAAGSEPQVSPVHMDRRRAGS